MYLITKKCWLPSLPFSKLDGIHLFNVMQVFTYANSGISILSLIIKGEPCLECVAGMENGVRKISRVGGNHSIRELGP